MASLMFISINLVCSPSAFSHTSMIFSFTRWKVLSGWFYTRRRFVGEDPSCTQQVHWDLGVDLAGEEKPEASVGGDGVQLLLQRDQPGRSKMHILQQNPSTSPDSSVNRLLRLAKALGGADCNRGDRLSKLRSKVI